MARNQDEARKEQILRTALGLFLKKGYEGTPTREIAEILGMSKANLYYHFPAKEDVLRALYLPSFAKVEELLDRAEGRGEAMEGYLEIMLEDRELAILMATDLSVLSRPEIGEKAAELNERLLATVAGEGASLEDRMRAEGALGVLRSMIGFPEADGERARRVGLAAAEAVLASGG